MSQILIKVRDYTLEPFGRYETDGEGNGEEFRKKYILPALRGGDDVLVDLDGINDGYGSSFIVEAFANLIRKENFSYAEIKTRLKFKSTNTKWIKEIESYIDATKDKDNSVINSVLKWK
ncbi:STAS-like domain-containing protein [Pseudoalteromonas sp. Angola-4]|nr:STAS-like domain-containing protein [Pseudoalteromonas sp. Angola-4]MDC9508971.1 STAS-like domain-containing protein [Pseudoalteromonas sp. Angola-4]